MNRVRLALPVLAVVVAFGALVPGAPRVAAQAGADGWETLAGGDEVLTLALDPTDANRLYAGTEGGGLVVWDLARGAFTQYLFPGQVGLASNDVRDIAVDEAGLLWLATPEGVTRAAPGTATWRTYDVADGLPSQDITAVAVGDDGWVWAGSYDNGVAVLEPGATRWTAIAPEKFVAGDDATAKSGPGAARVADIAVGPDGRVWVAHGREDVDKPALSVYAPADRAWHHISPVTPGTDATDGPATDHVLALAFDDEGVLWLGTWGRGIQTFDASADTWARITAQDGLCGDNVWALATDRGNVWAACEGDRGAAHWDGDQWTIWRTDGANGSGAGLPTDAVRAVAAARDVVWLGTNGVGSGGLGIVPVDGASVGEPLSTSLTTPPSNDVTALAVDPEGGDLYAGTRGQGLMIFDGRSWTRHTRASTDDLLAGDTITDLLVRERELWVATTPVDYSGGSFVDGGVSVLELDTGVWRDPLTTARGLPGNDVGSLALDADGRVWIGTGHGTGGAGYDGAVHQGKGIAVYDPVADRIDEVYTYADDGSSLAGNTVLDIARGPDGMWLAASYHVGSDQRRHGGGVSEYAAGWTTWFGGQDDLRTYHGSGVPTDQDPYINGDVRSIAVSPAGDVWAGTWDLETASLELTWPAVDAVVNHKTGTHWTPYDFAGDGWVSALVASAGGDVWAGTTRGHEVQEADLSSMRRSDTARGGIRLWRGGEWTELTPRTSGLASRAITALALDPTSGDLWVGTENNGLSRLRDASEPQETPTPCADCPTGTPAPAATSTGPLVMTLTPGGPTFRPGTDTPPWPRPTDVPTPKPPPEVPEPATLFLVGGGLVALLVWAQIRRRQQAGEGP
jgi:ligand-binding sensor domain-containing protein